MKNAPRSNATCLRVFPPFRGRGFTLIELAVTLSILGVLLVGIGTSIALASKALPDADRVDLRLADAQDAVGVLSDELACATYFTERTATAVTFLIPDRDGDGRSERVRYAWAGEGQPLTRQLNGGDVVAVLPGVESLAFSYQQRQRDETYIGPKEEQAERRLSEYPYAVDGGGFSVNGNQVISQGFRVPDDVANALSVRLTRARFFLRSDDTLGLLRTGTTRLHVRAANADYTPTSTAVLPTVSIHESSLSDSYGWREFTLGGSPIAPGALLAFVFDGVDLLSYASVVRYDEDGPNNSNTYVSSNGGQSWNLRNEHEVLHEIFGRYTVQLPDQTLRHMHTTAVGIELSVSDEPGGKVSTAVRTLNAPEALARYWRADFSVSPTQVDADGDGTVDWVLRSGSPTGLINALLGLLLPPAPVVLATQPACDFDKPTVVSARFRATSTAGDAVVSLHADATSGGQAVPIQATLSKQGGGQTLVVRHGSSGGTVQILQITGLPDRLIDLRLLIDPVKNTIHVSVDGVSQGTWRYTPYSVGTVDRAVVLQLGTGTQFDLIDVRVGGESP